MPQTKTACITFLGNPNLDSRLVNLTRSLRSEGMRVKVIGFDWQSDNFKSIESDVSIFKLSKQKFSLMFYFNFIKILFSQLTKIKADYYFAEDVYVLPITHLFSKLRKAKLYYNSRELYSHIGGLRRKKKAQWAISIVEKIFIKKPDYVLTTGEMDATYLEKIYGITNTLVLRNLPSYKKPTGIINYKKLFNLPENRKIILYQGVLLEGRGISLTLKALVHLPYVDFVILGEGVFRSKYEEEAKKLNVWDRTHFLGAIKHEELINYTAGADIGLALIENISLSYYYALPNKLFEYIIAGIPALVTELPQMERIVKEYNVGEILPDETAVGLSEILIKMFNEEELMRNYKENCIKAAKELNWEVEFNKVKNLLL